MPETDDAAKEIAREHDEIDRLSVRICTLSAGADRAAAVHEACVRFAYHVHVEEKHLHQAMRRHLPDGSAVVDAQRRRDRAVLRTVEYCELPDVETDELDVLVGQLVVGIQDHVERYDADLLPALIRACPLAESRRVAELLRAALQAVRDAVKIGDGSKRAPVDAESMPEPHHRGLRGLLHHRAAETEAERRGYAT
ncbi:hemerythrin domain-containing protein [Actinospica sp.]|uniref:hemerythrin domain-containing protein n=1 Tax=Actinospica sp. TaxID=1872142 RepID=UPI002CBCBF34|nr:hemerythrin domain-containing protein [Actinospica sp.]HWG22576.1 hemerythrin domain-containing protein [Actinospica sp.]